MHDRCFGGEGFVKFRVLARIPSVSERKMAFGERYSIFQCKIFLLHRDKFINEENEREK